MNVMEHQDQTQITKAVIYCRVSSKRQVKEGHGLDSQETRCREHARRLGYDVLETFPDKAVSGGKLHRPSFNRLLAYVEAQDSAVAVIIDDISRFSRDIESHWALRRALKAVGGKLESPSVQFGEDAHPSSLRTCWPLSANINANTMANKPAIACKQGRSMAFGVSHHLPGTRSRNGPDRAKCLSQKTRWRELSAQRSPALPVVTLKRRPR